MVYVMPKHVRQNFLYAKIFHRWNREDSNSDFMIIGQTGSGKSSLALRIAYDIDPDFSLERVVYSVHDFLKLFVDGDSKGKLKKGSVIIFDEIAGSEEGADSRSSLSKSNKTLGKLKTIYRDSALTVFYIAPSLTQIDKNIKMVSTTGVLWCQYNNHQEKSIKARLYWSDMNPMSGQAYKKMPVLWRPLEEKRVRLKALVFDWSPAWLYKDYLGVKLKFKTAMAKEWIGKYSEQEAEEKILSRSEIIEKIKCSPDEYKTGDKFDWSVIKESFGIGINLAQKITSSLNKGVV